MPPMRKVRPCGASLAATWEGVKKNTRFFWNAVSTRAVAMASAVIHGNVATSGQDDVDALLGERG